MWQLSSSLVCLSVAVLVRSILICCVFLLSLTGSGQFTFVENKGQWPNQVVAATDLTFGKLFIEKSGLTYHLLDPEFIRSLHPSGVAPVDSIRGHAYSVTWKNALPHPQFNGEKPFNYYHNYYIGSEDQWADHCSVFRSCQLKEIYSNVDVRIHAPTDQLKYDFVVHPLGDPRQIVMVYNDVNELYLRGENLIVETSVGTITEAAPFAYQLRNGKIEEIVCSYQIIDNEVVFELGNYDRSIDLIIDPEIAFSTFVGSTASNFGFTASNDSQENLISGAAVFNAGYPTTAGAYSTSYNNQSSNYMDVGISKFDNTGSQLLYSTYLGGGLQETPHSIVVNSNDDIIVMGVTGSDNFPTTSGAYLTFFSGGTNLPMNTLFTSSHPNGCDIFLTKFSSAGLLLQSTYVGGNENDGLNIGDQLFYNYGDVFRGEVNVDANDNIFIATCTRGGIGFPPGSAQTAFGGGITDGIVMKFNPTLSTFLNGTYIGGVDNDACYAIEFEADGTLIVAGGTKSQNFPHCTNGFDTNFDDQTDGFILKLDPNTLQVENGTFVGTPEYDQVYFIQTDLDGNIYALGQTAGDMPITPGLYGQPNSGQFISKFDPTLSNLIWNTTIGTGSGEIDISPTAFLVSDCNQIFFSGWGGHTNSVTCSFSYDCYAVESTTIGLPITADAVQPSTDGSDFYLCVLSAEASDIIYASYLGGAQSSEHVDGGTSRFSKNGTVYQAVCAGCQGNSDFPSTPNAWSPTNPSTGCNLAVFRFNLGQIEAEVNIDGPDEICDGSPANFINLSIGSNQYEWSFGDGEGSTDVNASHTYPAPGTYEVQLIASHTSDCLISDTTYITLTVLPGVDPTAIEVPDVCPGTEVNLSGTGSDNAFWDEDPLLSDNSILNPTAVVDATHTFYFIDFNDCDNDTVAITVNVFPVNTTVSPEQTICQGASVDLVCTGGQTYSWSPPDGLNNTLGATVTATPNDTTTYFITITTIDGCTSEEEVTVNVDVQSIGGNVYPNDSLCLGQSVTLSAQNASSYSWSPSNTLSNSSVQHPIASPTNTTTYTVHLANSCAEGEDQVTVVVIIPQAFASEDGVICSGTPFPAKASGGSTYYWTPAALAAPPDQAETLLYPTATTTFTVAVTDDFGCVASDELTVTVLPSPNVYAGPDVSFEIPGSIQLVGDPGGLPFEWSPANGLSCTDCLYPYANPDEPTYYTIRVIDALGCVGSDSVLVTPYFPLYAPNTITPNNDGLNDVFYIEGENIPGYHLEIYNRWGDKIFESDDREQPWVPQINGYYVQDGTYIWVLEFDSIDRRKQLVGHVNVLR